MVFIRVDIAVNEELLRKIADDIHDQAKTGIIVLPHFCTLLNDVPLHSDDHAEMDTNRKVRVYTHDGCQFEFE